MKDYGNSVALFGALGCMVLLVISMQFSKHEDKQERDNVSAGVVVDDNGSSENENIVGTDVSSVEGTGISGSADVSGGTTDTSVTTAPTEGEPTVPEAVLSGEFIGPITKEMEAERAAAIKVDPEILHEIYPEELCIIGDSIASGFGAYQVLSNPFDFTANNIAAWSASDYTFSYDGSEYSYAEALETAQPAYIYLSMGMNDVNISTSDTYAENYRLIIEAVQEACPDSNIIVAGITPVTAGTTYTSNSTVQKFNEKLQETVGSFDSYRICYYDTAGVLADAATGSLAGDYDGGDGVHISYAAYNALLENLYPILDEMPVPQIVLDELDEYESSASEADPEQETEASSEDEEQGASEESTDSE